MMRMPSFLTGRRKDSRLLRTALRDDTVVASPNAFRERAKAVAHFDRKKATQRTAIFEQMESRTMFNVDPIWVGGVYVEEDTGSDAHGDTFYISFTGGAAGTKMTKLIIDGDQGEPGFDRGDVFFDTLPTGLGADHAFPFEIVELRTANPNAKVTAEVVDGSSQLILHFENFQAGDLLVFSIDVEEVEIYDPSETDLEITNEGFDPITSGVEFQSSAFKAYFAAPHYQDIDGSSEFWNRYDSYLEGTNLDLPLDNANGLRDRTAGTAFSVTQIPKPISIAGTVFVDSNLNLVKDGNEQPLSGVVLELYRKEGNQFISTGHRATTDVNGKYEFGINLNLQPGTYEIRETQPNGYYSVGAVPGKLADGTIVGSTVLTNADVLTQIEILLGDLHAKELNFAEAQPTSIRGFVYQDLDNDGIREAGEVGIGGVQIRLESISTVNGSIIRTATTAADGSYSFTNLPPGRYRVVQVQQPAGFFDGKDTAGRVGNQTRGVVTVNEVIDAIQLNGNENGVEFNFGELPPSTLQGYVHIVNPGYDCDDTDPAAHTPLPGVTVQLLNSTGTVVATQVTRNDGSYKFENLPAGVYTIREITPAGVIDGGATVGLINGQMVGQVDGTSNIIAINVLPGQDGVEYNFCELLPGEISGHVFEDVNDDGIRQTDEPLLTGVQIDLFDAAGNLVDSVTTDQSGFYSFRFLGPGVYRLRETTPAGFLDGKDIAGTIGGARVGVVNSAADTISQINLPHGMKGINYDFGELRPGSLAGAVIVDVNDNNVIDTPAERPLAGVTIHLLDSSGNIVQTTTTNANGEYLFTDIRPGKYSVREVQPNGFFNGKTYVGSHGGDASELDLIRGFTINSGASLVDYDFTEIPPAQIAGYVFIDSNGDCLVQPGEQALANVRVDLIDANGVVLQTTRTAADGSYSFTNLAPGRYAIRETQPEGYFQGNQRAGSGGGDATVQDIITAIDINGGDALVNYNFCEIEPGTLEGYVFIDLDDDCMPDVNEKTLSGVRIDLLDSSGNLLRTTYTDANGKYRFENLAPGRYGVRETQPEGYFQGKQKAGSGGGNASVQDIVTAIDIVGGDDLVDYNFCELEPASLAGVVFADLDLDCIMDPNEQPISGVRVELLDSSGQVINFTVTDGQGRYTFTNLQPGRYSVREIQPQGYFQGGQTAPAGRADTSIDDILANIDLANGEFLDDLNFCETPPATIAGYVFQDGDVITNATGEVPDALRPVRDGQRDAGDKPLANVVLELRAVSGIPFPSSRALPGTYTGDTIRVTTDANGYFEFIGLRPGTYHVYQVQPEGYIDGLDTPGTTGGLSLNPEDLPNDPEAAGLLSLLALDDATNPRHDAILMIQIGAGQVSRENNFSEVLVRQEQPIPPIDPPKTPFEPPRDLPSLYPQLQVVLPPPPPPMIVPDLMIAGAASADYTWHLSVINAGMPRGSATAMQVNKAKLADIASILDVYHWKVAKMKSSEWSFVSVEQNKTQLVSKNAFDIPEAIPLAGDFNGDGVDELALFLEGEWLIDVNGNGRWDDGDMWAKLGDKADMPVIGDWDGDGKDDIGVFGPEWDGDDVAITNEAGLPDSENFRRNRPKNIPREDEVAENQRRILQRGTDGLGRSDVIDHVFRQGVRGDRPISGDFNGDGISTVGIYREGRWRLDTNGDGKWNAASDDQFEFGRPGDMPVVGDFDGDGIDDIAVIRNGKLIVDSNRNGQEDVTDLVFELESEDGEYIVGDFDGDGIDQAALHRGLSPANYSRVVEQNAAAAKLDR